MEQQPPEQAPLLAPLHQKSERGGEPVNSQKERIIKEHLSEIVGRKLRRVFDPFEDCPGERPAQQQVHDRRDQLEKYLENPDVRHRDEAERAVARTKERAPVFPHTLQRAVGPTETLPCERAQSVGRFRPGDSSLFVADLVAETTRFDR